MPDLCGEDGRGRSHVHLDRVFGWLQRLELATQQRRVHEVALAGGEALPEQLLRAAQVDVVDVPRVVLFEVVLVIMLER